MNFWHCNFYRSEYFFHHRLLSIECWGTKHPSSKSSVLPLWTHWSMQTLWDCFSEQENTDQGQSGLEDRLSTLQAVYRRILRFNSCTKADYIIQQTCTSTFITLLLLYCLQIINAAQTVQPNPIRGIQRGFSETALSAASHHNHNKL